MHILIAILLVITGSTNNSWRDADAGSLGVSQLIPAEGLAPARRIISSGLNGLPFAPEGLSDCAEMDFYRVQAGLPSRFSSIGWRESNCRNEESVHTFCCFGYWQLHKDHFYVGSIFDNECDVRSRFDIDSDTPIDKQRQACSAYRLFQRDGYSPWQ